MTPAAIRVDVLHAGEQYTDVSSGGNTFSFPYNLVVCHLDICARTLSHIPDEHKPAPAPACGDLDLSPACDRFPHATRWRRGGPHASFASLSMRDAGLVAVVTHSERPPFSGSDRADPSSLASSLMQRPEVKVPELSRTESRGSPTTASTCRSFHRQPGEGGGVCRHDQERQPPARPPISPWRLRRGRNVSWVDAGSAIYLSGQEKVVPAR